MRMRGVSQLAIGQNGVGAFILQCKRIEFHYCDQAGSSRGMKLFIQHHLPSFAAKHPQIEMMISPTPNRHPIMKGYYINGRNKPVCVRNLDQLHIRKMVEYLRDSSGEKVKKVNKAVTSINESVRGIWSPYHGKPLRI